MCRVTGEFKILFSHPVVVHEVDLQQGVFP